MDLSSSTSKVSEAIEGITKVVILLLRLFLTRPCLLRLSVIESHITICKYFSETKLINNRSLFRNWPYKTLRIPARKLGSGLVLHHL